MKLTTLLQDVILYEGLIHSTDIDTTADMLERWRPPDVIYRIIKRSSNAIHIEFTTTPSKIQVDRLIQFINNLGWFIASYQTWWKLSSTKYNYESFINAIEIDDLYWIRIEAKYDLELNKYDLPDLYHVSPEKFEQKIKAIGLIPKKEEKKSAHPERIYLTKTEEDAEALVNAFRKFHEGTYNLYKIDIDKLRRKNNGIRFFNDPQYSTAGIYTLSNIPPDCLTLIKQIKL